MEGRSCALGCIGAFAVYSLVIIILVALFSETFDRLFLLKLFAGPVLLTMPLGPPAAMALLFAIAGPRRGNARTIARMLAAIVLYAALFMVLMSYAMVGRLVLPGKDAVILIMLLAVGLALALWGFGRPPKRSMAPVQPQVHPDQP